ncbi:hypothetical protein B0H16DRAFT_1847430 [Mycena metata]|uniref:Endonuclease/exonuclease/phosphatase domain-containing protein n=1 Tax=Mycena metata TaxID=1033252 RepID=A0AAD7N7H7_9AGAR|nr:hypothetical protein B0H16DRAFT_1847430 [Mycena metata]
MAGKGKVRSQKQPRPSLVTVDIDKLRDILSQCQEQPAAAIEAPSANFRGVRVLMRRARKILAGSLAAPLLPLNASLVSPPRSPSLTPSPKPVHRPAPQLRIFAHQASCTGAENLFSALASAAATSLTEETHTNTPIPCWERRQRKRGGANPNLPPPLADRHPHPAKPIPITSTPDERILLRCEGDSPPSFALPYHDLVAHINSVLVLLDLPRIICASRTKDGIIFLAPECKETVKLLVESWARWGPVGFPGARIVPPAVYSHIQLNSIPHAAAPDLDALAAELMERYPQLGVVVGSPVWVNKPPSEAQISAGLSTASKPRMAGSVFVRLELCEKVDLPVSSSCIFVLPSAGAVSSLGMLRRSAPSKSEVWRMRGKGTWSARKAKALALHQRAIELTAYLNSTSTMAPRLPDSLEMITLVQINSWKSRRPLDLLMCDNDPDIICVQEPHQNEILNACELPGYAHIFPDAHDHHPRPRYVYCISPTPSAMTITTLFSPTSTSPPECLTRRDSPNLGNGHRVVYLVFAKLSSYLVAALRA